MYFSAGLCPHAAQPRLRIAHSPALIVFIELAVDSHGMECAWRRQRPKVRNIASRGRDILETTHAQHQFIAAQLRVCLGFFPYVPEFELLAAITDRNSLSNPSISSRNFPSSRSVRKVADI
jgi:hypothetical protein